jgi:hypothetical protein
LNDTQAYVIVSFNMNSVLQMALYDTIWMFCKTTAALQSCQSMEEPVILPEVQRKLNSYKR